VIGALELEARLLLAESIRYRQLLSVTISHKQTCCTEAISYRQLLSVTIAYDPTCCAEANRWYLSLSWSSTRIRASPMASDTRSLISFS